jgi:hypothetical protein
MTTLKKNMAIKKEATSPKRAVPRAMGMRFMNLHLKHPAARSKIIKPSPPISVNTTITTCKITGRPPSKSSINSIPSLAKNKNIVRLVKNNGNVIVGGLKQKMLRKATEISASKNKIKGMNRNVRNAEIV